jgi:hypothetical protein
MSKRMLAGARFFLATLMVALCLGFAPNVQALTFTLNNWNDPVLDASTDAVKVDVATVSGFTQIDVYWFAGDSGLTAIGIDQFAYDGVTAMVSSEPASWIPPPPSAGFTYGGVQNMDGFGSFYAKGQDPGGTLGTSFANRIIFTLNSDVTSSFTSNTQFAAHVRYGDGCSGFVSGRTAEGNATSSCGSSVPEPASLLLLSAGLAGIGIWRRKAGKIG